MKPTVRACACNTTIGSSLCKFRKLWIQIPVFTTVGQGSNPTRSDSTLAPDQTQPLPSAF